MSASLVSRNGCTCRTAALPARTHLSVPRRLHVSRPTRVLTSQIRAEGRSSDSNFMAGFVAGGVLFGALGFLFAPQISKALLGDDQKLKLPRFLDDDQAKDPEATKQDLVEKIAQLNASIDEVAAQLKTKEDTSPVVEGETLKLS